MEKHIYIAYEEFWDSLIGSDLNKSDIELLSYLIKNYGEGVIFSISNSIKEDLCTKTKKSITSYNNSTKKLVKSGFLIKKSAKSYIVNPTYAFRGSSNLRKKLILSVEQDNL